MSALQFGPMTRLDPASILYIVVHTQGSPDGSHGSLGAIHRFHRAAPPHGRGWSGIGYHRLIGEHGENQEGRPIQYRGAHVEGLNHCSLGICCTGNGDLANFNGAQRTELARQVAEWMEEYRVPLGRVIGHYEVNKIGGLPPVIKSCPGTRVSMKKLRELVLVELMETWPAPKVVSYPDPPPLAPELDLEMR